VLARKPRPPRSHARAGLASGWVFAALLALAPSGVARAQTPAEIAEARQLFMEGATLADEGKWDAARDRYERSLAKKRSALTLYNLGITQQKTGRLVDALATFRAFLAEPVEASTEPYVQPV
jgi:hypothetical protein